MAEKWKRILESSSPEDRGRRIRERRCATVCGKNIVGRIATSVFFWGMAGVLVASSRDSIVKIMGKMDSGVQEVSQTLPNPDESGQLYAEQENRSVQTAASVWQENVSAEPEQKRVALTFDDGPHPVYTAQLLDGLAERGIHATFFVIGKNIEGNEDILARMDAEGHLIGNHTYDHVKICDISGEDACEQVEKTSSLVKEITGKDTEFVRPPFGAWNREMECSFVMIPVMWDVDPLDWTTKNTDLVVERVLDEVQNEDIILLHDYYESSVEAALRIVDELQAQGYEFVTADELILE